MQQGFKVRREKNTLKCETLPRGKKKLAFWLIARWLACSCGEDKENSTAVDSPENLDLIFAYCRHLGDLSPSSAARCKGQSSGGRIRISESDAIYDVKTTCVSSRVRVAKQLLLPLLFIILSPNRMKCGKEIPEVSNWACSGSKARQQEEAATWWFAGLGNVSICVLMAWGQLFCMYELLPCRHEAPNVDFSVSFTAQVFPSAFRRRLMEPNPRDG